MKNVKLVLLNAFFSILADSSGQNIPTHLNQDDLIPKIGPQVATGNQLQPHLVLHQGATVFSNIAEAISHEAEVREKK